MSFQDCCWDLGVMDNWSQASANRKSEYVYVELSTFDICFCEDSSAWCSRFDASLLYFTNLQDICL